MKRSLFALTAAGLVASGASASTILATDDFTYPDGGLVAQSAWTNHSGSGSFIQVASGAAVVAHGGGSREDAGLTFASQTTGILTATFDIVVTEGNGFTGTDFEYFAHFMQEGSFNFRSRLSIAAPTGAGDYSIGLATSSSTEEATSTTDFSYGATVPIVLEFDLDTGIANATVGTESLVATGVELGETLDRFALRQSGSSNNETITVDNLTVTWVPEPTSLALLGLGGLIVARRRRG